MSEAVYRPTQVGGALDATLEVRPDGSRVLRSTEPLRWFPERITDALV